MNVGLVISYYSQTYHQFLLSRIIEGVAAGAILSAMRTVFKDIVRGERLALLYSYMGIVVAFGPALAPVFGGVITSVFSWRLIFLLLLVVFIILFFVVWFKFPETLSLATQKKNRKEKVLSHALQALRCFPFICYTLSTLFIYAAYMAYITASPIIIQTHLHYSPTQYGGITLIVLLVGQASKVYNVFHLEKKGSAFMIRLGCCLMAVGAVWLMLNACLHYYSLLSLICPIILFINGASIIQPSVVGRAMSVFDHIVGMAATVYSVLFLLGATVGSGIISKLSEETFFPIATVVLVAVVLSIIALMLALRFDKLHR